MKRLLLLVSLLLLVLLLSQQKAMAQNPENWTSQQLMEPSELATAISSQKNVPVIISVGPGAPIPNSIHTGMASEQEGLAKLKEQLKTLPKDQKIVIYCGCCPFEHCPNVRPAINALKELQFTNYYLLDLSHNVKKDWIDQGYPVAKQE